MKITSQVKTLAVKSAFKTWASIFGVKINRYHADNERFNEQLFRSALEDDNQTITFCGVGSHHSNAIVERKILTILLGARKLLLHAKINWPEAIPTMLLPYTLKIFLENFNELKVGG